MALAVHTAASDDLRRVPSCPTRALDPPAGFDPGSEHKVHTGPFFPFPAVANIDSFFFCYTALDRSPTACTIRFDMLSLKRSISFVSERAIASTSASSSISGRASTRAARCARPRPPSSITWFVQHSSMHTSSAPKTSTTIYSSDSNVSSSHPHALSSSSGASGSASSGGKSKSGRSRVGVIATSGVLAAVALATAYRQVTGYSDAAHNSSLFANSSSDPLSLLSPAELHASTSHLDEVSLKQLLRQYVVYLGFEQAALVQAGPWILKQLEALRDNVPLVGPMMWSIFRFTMKNTFYDVFVGGATVTECGPLIEDYLNRGIGISLSYSVEASVDGSAQAVGVNKKHIREAVEALKATAVFGPKPPSTVASSRSISEATPIVATAASHIRAILLAIKLTGFIFDPSLLARATTALVGSSSPIQLFSPSIVVPEHGVSPFPASPALSDEDHRQLAQLYAGLRQISATAREQGVRLLIDAEQSWYQDAIDHLATLLALEFNAAPSTTAESVLGPSSPIVYNTYQCYRRSTPERLAADMAFARAHNLSFGAKLVRGAYVEYERMRHANLVEQGQAEGECCIWSSKAETDACYDQCAAVIIEQMAKDTRTMTPGTGCVGLFAATHNATSVQKVIRGLRDEGLIKFKEDGSAEIDDKLRGRLVFGQLMGMSDNLTSAISRVLSPSGMAPVGELSGSLPLVVKWTPYSSIDEALPYLIRRANENQSILQSDPTSGRGGAKEERRAVGREIRRRFGLAF
ncbi:BQ5605_C007g04671 [Microbotryum silenes-dioicae]|uniref:Proline dehydrogenase n=1 Tax=Microbotryum silenes-dioicae TaxID=796604 RepID=A0A2X0N1S6_9BASI|nr:BQ5605_C007g04671 [Microbotryum silenes-dioicae]